VYDETRRSLPVLVVGTDGPACPPWRIHAVGPRFARLERTLGRVDFRAAGGLAREHRAVKVVDRVIARTTE
jgi:hypothetical protein